MGPEANTADLLKAVLQAATGMLSRGIPVVDDRIRPSEFKVRSRLILEHSVLQKLERQKTELETQLKETDDTLYALTTENDALERTNEALRYELDTLRNNPPWKRHL